MKHIFLQTMSVLSCLLFVSTIGNAQKINSPHSLLKSDAINVITIDIECDGIAGYNYTSDSPVGGVIQNQSSQTNRPVPQVLLIDVEVNEEPYSFITNDQFVSKFEGPGIKNDVFYPELAGVGTHTIIYTASNSTGCKASRKIIITVNDGPDDPIKKNSIDISMESDQIYIDNPDQQDIRVQVFTRYGEILSSHSAKNSLYIDTDPNYNGIYIINVQGESGVHTRQIYVR